MKLYPYARLNEHGHAVALFSSSATKRTAAYRRPCPVDRTDDLDALLGAVQGVLGVELPIDGAALSRLCLDAYEAVGGDDQPVRPGDADEDRSPGLWATWLQADDGEFYQFRVDITRDKWSESSVPELISAVAVKDALPEGKRTGWAYTSYEHNLTGEPVAPFKMR